jgi:hypothetical protein
VDANRAFVNVEDPSAGSLERASLAGASYPETAVWAYNGQTPGPEIRLSQGGRVRVLVENRLPKDTTIHWHGVRVPNAMDGAPYVSQPPIQPEESFTYEFTIPDAGIRGTVNADLVKRRPHSADAARRQPPLAASVTPCVPAFAQSANGWRCRWQASQVLCGFPSRLQKSGREAAGVQAHQQSLMYRLIAWIAM